MKKKSASTDKNSLKIVVFFVVSVAILITISLAVKTILMIRVSKFDGSHRFTILIEQKKSAIELLSFDPGVPSLVILQLKGASLSSASVGETLGILPDASIVLPDDFQLAQNSPNEMGSLLWSFNRLRTDLTLYDMFRFYFLVKSITLANNRVLSLTLPLESNEIDKVVSSEFLDTSVSQENISVQVINASGVPGLANRLARVIANMGGDVVSVTTSQDFSAHSSIHYFGASSYTLFKFSRLLRYPVSSLTNETIADILITIGKDSGSPTKF